MIPKIIHYCWFGKQPLSKLAIQCIESWKKYCPDYEIVQWNEDNYDIESKCEYVKEAYEAKKWAFVSDYARLDIVYRHGGVYLDTDVELVQNLDSILNHECFLAQETSGYIATGLGFGAIKNSEYIQKMLDEYKYIHFKLGKDIYDTIPCPTRNTAPFVKIGFKAGNMVQKLNECIIYSPEYFCPLNCVTNEMKITENTIAIHHYNASWISEEEKKLSLELAEYSKTHGKLRTFCWKNNKEFQILSSKNKVQNLFEFLLYKIKKKILLLKRRFL